MMTDFINSVWSLGNWIKMIDKELYAVLREFKLHEHDFFPVVIEANGKNIYSHGILRWRDEYADMQSDFNVSEFYWKKIRAEEYVDLNIKTFKDLLAEFEIFRIGYYRFRKLVQAKSFEYDFFRVRINRRTYCSEKLKRRLAYEGFTGLLFEEEPAIQFLVEYFPTHPPSQIPTPHRYYH